MTIRRCLAGSAKRIRRTSFLLAIALLALPALAPAQATRVEFHLLPPVSTGPMDPAWSPDGEWIAFSMHGDIWKVPADGGEAMALTQGPSYHFEPAWSRDGSRIALSYEIDGDLEIGIVDADGGAVQRITNSPGYDLQPEWGHLDRLLYFASQRNGGFDIFGAYPVTPGNVTSGNFSVGDATIGGRGNQYQPSVSPDGLFLTYVAPAPGQLGSGAIWTQQVVQAADVFAPFLVHAEETSYRAEPRWSADRDLLFVGCGGFQRHRGGAGAGREPGALDRGSVGRIRRHREPRRHPRRLCFQSRRADAPLHHGRRRRAAQLLA